MKQTFALLILCAALTGCGNNSGNSETKSDSANAGVADTTRATDQTAVARQPEIDTSINNIGTDQPIDEAATKEAVKSTKQAAKKIEKKEETQPAVSSASDGKKGKELISKSDCLACHKETEKLVGPAYSDVAKKYEATEKNMTYLAGKIKSGGAGVWGQIPMTPHPTLSDEDAMEMVTYILSLRK